MGSELEKSWEAKLVRWCKSKGLLCLKYENQNETGYPDRIVITREGKHIWIECKREGESARNLQLYRMEQLRGRKVVVQCVDSLQKAIALIEEHL
jgi:hypothetical protein